MWSAATARSSRSIALPRNVDGNGVTANLQDGVLLVQLPKHETAKPRQINIAATMPGHQVPATVSDTPVEQTENS